MSYCKAEYYQTERTITAHEIGWKKQHTESIKLDIENTECNAVCIIIVEYHEI